MRQTPNRRFHFRDDRGAATTELVIAFPAFLTMLLLVVQAGLYYHARNLASTAAQEGVAISSELGRDLSDGQAEAQHYLDNASGLWDATPNVDAHWVDGNGNPVLTASGAQAVEVEVGGTVQSVVPFADIIPTFINLTVNENSQRPVERFRPLTEG